MNKPNKDENNVIEQNFKKNSENVQPQEKFENNNSVIKID